MGNLEEPLSDRKDFSKDFSPINEISKGVKLNQKYNGGFYHQKIFHTFGRNREVVYDVDERELHISGSERIPHVYAYDIFWWGNPLDREATEVSGVIFVRNEPIRYTFHEHLEDNF